MALILRSDDIKPLEKAWQHYGNKSKILVNHVAFLFVSCINLRKVTVLPHRSIFSFLAEKKKLDLRKPELVFYLQFDNTQKQVVEEHNPIYPVIPHFKCIQRGYQGKKRPFSYLWSMAFNFFTVARDC